MQGNQPSAEYLIPRIVVLGEVDRHKKVAGPGHPLYHLLLGLPAPIN